MFIHLACKKLINTYFFECAISLVIVANSALRLGKKVEVLPPG